MRLRARAGEKRVLSACLALVALACWLDGPVKGEEYERLDHLLRPIREDAGVPSLAAAVVVEGKIRGAGAVGVRRLPDGRPVTVLDRYHVGSCTKSMTATLAATLVEAGVIDWGTTVGEVLDSLEPNEAFRGVTLRDLLSHRGGFPRRVPSSLWDRAVEGEGSPRQQRRKFVRAMVRRSPPVRPRTIPSRSLRPRRFTGRSSTSPSMFASTRGGAAPSSVGPSRSRRCIGPVLPATATRWGGSWCAGAGRRAMCSLTRDRTPCFTASCGSPRRSASPP